ncbi:uncharacterized protein LOC126837217 [Adelges cooleyi]|uniref:uncharacterized protein LOC126837217 n=1 Tax=Adelges cooleyi TaxID=133065 RepID=UPI002180684B|nr:uncharacterized protein LOC126837217 [Adelges cooleyi]
MAHSTILKTIVFCSLLFFGQTAQLLETGYQYPSDVIIGIDRLYEDLRCTYLLSGLTHMRVSQLLVYEHYKTLTNPSIGDLSYYSRNIKYQIASLRSINIKRIGALWLINFYTSLITCFNETTKNTAAAYQKLLATTQYIIEKLRTDTTECPKNNLFDNYDSIIKSYPSLTIVALKKMLGRIDKEANTLLTNNHIVFYEKLYYDKFDETLKVRNLMMNSSGKFDIFKKDLMYVYNVHVDWSDISERLEKSWFAARTLDWFNDHLEHIKSYYTMNFAFLKIIMIQLTLKHMTYLQVYDVGSDKYVQYAHQWYDLVEKFACMLHLTKEQHVESLLTAVHNLYKGTQKIDSVISCVFAMLVSLCTYLGCKPTEPFHILENKEFQIPYVCGIMDDVELMKSTTSRAPIEYNSLENTRIFLCHLSRLFQNVDFDYIQLLMEYIDEITFENDMKRYYSSMVTNL